MSSFKELMAQDIAIFLNSEEFGGPHDIDGERVNCILDDTLQQIKGLDGAYEAVTMLFIKAESLPDRPVPQQHMRIDGDLRLVRTCSGNEMLEITLEAYEA